MIPKKELKRIKGDALAFPAGKSGYIRGACDEYEFLTQASNIQAVDDLLNEHVDIGNGIDCANFIQALDQQFIVIKRNP